MSDFHKNILSSFTESLDNFYPDNVDWEIRKPGRRRWLKLQFETLVNWLLRFTGKDSAVTFSSGKNYFCQNINLFEETYNFLQDDSSKKRYIELLVYQMLGFTKVKLSLNDDGYWASRANVDLFKRAERIPANFRKGYLDLYDLTNAGYDLKLYFVQNGIFVDFILQQYNYQDIVCVNKGDVVIDAGGCWGDTALYFAARGAERVFVYEFIPSNIEIMNKNLALNPQYMGKVSVVDKAVWEKSAIDLSFVDRGPASQVAESGVYSGMTQTLSIDDLAKEKCLNRVNFLKMDIEGAELSALKGAAETISRYKPKLAISVYHRNDDLIAIPAYIRSLNPDYKFFLDYYTIFGDEAVLYAI